MQQLRANCARRILMNLAEQFLSCVVLLGHRGRFNIKISAAVIACHLFSSHVNLLVHRVGLRL